jgi:ATP-dependent DNA helicase RecG
MYFHPAPYVETDTDWQNPPLYVGRFTRSLKNTNYPASKDTTQESRFPMLLECYPVPRTREEMQGYICLEQREHFRKTFLTPLIASGKLQRTIPDKPASKYQKDVSPA